VVSRQDFVLPQPPEVTISVVEEAGHGRLETNAPAVEQRAPASVVETSVGWVVSTTFGAGAPLCSTSVIGGRAGAPVVVSRQDFVLAQPPEVTISVVEEAGYGRLETTAPVVEQRALASVVETSVGWVVSTTFGAGAPLCSTSVIGGRAASPGERRRDPRSPTRKVSRPATTRDTQATAVTPGSHPTASGSSSTTPAPDRSRPSTPAWSSTRPRASTSAPASRSTSPRWVRALVRRASPHDPESTPGVRQGKTW
jgi:hypothetical protein